MDWNFESGRIFANAEDRSTLAELTYRIREDGIAVIDHTFVSPLLRGQGVAGEMMTVAADDFRKRNLKITATCSYAHAWLKRHALAYNDILATAFEDEATACRIGGGNE